MKKHSVLLKHISRLMVLVMLLTLYSGSAVFADPILVNPPKNYRVEEIGYDVHEDWYAIFRWQHDGFPPGTDETQITASFHEIEYGTGRRITNSIQVTMPGNQSELTIDDSFDSETNPNTLKPGHIYETSLTASCSVVNTNTRIVSQRSNVIKFLTSVRVEARLIPGTNDIKITWDDEWDTDGRIDYGLYISDVSKDAIGKISLTETIRGSRIGQPDAPPVTVNAAERKLEYTFTGAYPGRRYSIKVVPVPRQGVVVAPEAEIPELQVTTNILIRAYRVGFTPDGDAIWNLIWDPVILDEDEFKVASRNYILYRYSSKNDDNPKQYLLPDITSYQIIIPKDDKTPYSFSVEAYVYSIDGDYLHFPSGARVELKEIIPQTPEAPEIVDSFPENPDITYDGLLTSRSATVMWKVPYNGEGVGDKFIDRDIVYDIYLVDDIRKVESPDEEDKIASDLSLGSANEIKAKNPVSGHTVIGYRYDLTNLKSQTIYYFVIRAKKYYPVETNVNGLIRVVPKAFISESSVKVIITKPDTGTDRIPEAPSAPPFAVKEDSITLNGATLLLKKRWDAYYDEESKRWRDISLLDPDDGESGTQNPPTKTINYEHGWKVIVYGIRYNYAMENISTPTIQYSDLSGKLKGLATILTEVSIPDIPENQNDQIFEFDITGLRENTAYVVWVTIANNDGQESNPSDPIIVNTKPRDVVNPVTPTAPTNIIAIAADNFIDLFWEFLPGMNYEIRCGTSEKLESASITNTVTYDDLAGTGYYRLTGLQPDTQYYIWIKAINPETGKESEYSNAVIVRTEAYTPPPAPTGFGVTDVTEKSITYVWTRLPEYTYILEIAENSNFEGGKTFEVDDETYTVTDLISNRRYYARLYAYDPVSGLRSQPTRTILVVTNRSRDDYDSGFDLSDVPTGDVLVISPKVIDGIWTASSTGINAHRMAEQVRSIPHYVVKIDLSRPPGKVQTVRLELGAVLIDAISEMGKELYIKLPSNDLIIRPQTLQTDEYFKMKTMDSNFTLRLDITSPATSYTQPSNLKLVAPITEIRIGPASTGRSFASLVRPIRVDFPVDNLRSYMANEIGTYLYDTGRRAWNAQETRTDYANGIVSGEMTKPGAMAAATRAVPTAGTVPRDVSDSLKAIQAVYALSSLESRTFRHADPVRQADIVKLLLDLTGTAYDDNDLLVQAARSGLISGPQAVTDGYARRDQAVSLLVSYYRFRTKLPVNPQNPSAWSRYQDLNRVSTGALNAVRFAIENGIVQETGNVFNPDKAITWGDLIVMIRRVLILCGDL